MTGHEGIVLDAETAVIVPIGARIETPTGAAFIYAVGWPAPWDYPELILTHLPTPTGLRPVAELVAVHDEAEGHAADLREWAGHATGDHNEDVADAYTAIADCLDQLRVTLINPALVAAAHKQWGMAT